MFTQRQISNRQKPMATLTQPVIIIEEALVLNNMTSQSVSIKNKIRN